MLVFEIVIALLLGGLVLAAIARRISAPYPALLALAGAALALIPGVPTIMLDPELALALFVAPVLVDAAFDASPRDLRQDWRAVTGLALGAVILTVVMVAWVAHTLVPGMTWPVAIALGAIVAPPDAAAATTVLKQLRPPHRLLVILEGESLFNDASALLIYRLAVGAAISGSISGWSVLPTLLIVTLGSFILGYVLARLVLMVNARVQDTATAIVFQFCTAFGVWIIAEQMHLSGIITMVVFAMTASRKAPEIMPARIRIPAWAVWEVAVFVLNVLAFILIGFQLKSILAGLSVTTGLQYAVIAGAVTAIVILARLLWVTGAAAFSRWRCRPRPDGSPGPHDTVSLSPGAAAVVGWCGMRGIVTLAAALALPNGTHGVEAFPHRDLIIVTAFAVVLGTLVVQGLTLRPLLERLGLEDDGAVDHEVRLARAETMRAAVDAGGSCPGDEDAKLVCQRYEVQLKRAEEELANPSRSGRTRGAEADAAIVRVASAAARRRLVELRADGTIGDAAFQRVEEELDWTELGWAQVLGVGEAGDTPEAAPAEAVIMR